MDSFFIIIFLKKIQKSFETYQFTLTLVILVPLASKTGQNESAFFIYIKP